MAVTKWTWGSIVNGSANPSGRKGKLGIYTSVSNNTNNTTATITIEVWFWTIYSCTDTSNTLYCNYGEGVTSATTSRGAVKISHSVASGTGWSTSNQTKVYSDTFTVNRQTSRKTYNVCAKLSGIDMLDSDVTVSASYQVDALASYLVQYNANEGSPAPSAQTKYYGQDIKLSTNSPSRKGYIFKGWATSSTGAVVYAPGDTYSANAAVTLHAVWQASTSTITFDANGGSGAPNAITKTNGTAITIPDTVPTRENYGFLGWSKSSSTNKPTYVAGNSYTDDGDVTLYAVWEFTYIKPGITNFSIGRCESDGTYSDEGVYARIRFNWTSTNPITNHMFMWSEAGSDTGVMSKDELDISTTSGSVDAIIGVDILDLMGEPVEFDTEKTYIINILLGDKVAATQIQVTLYPTTYTVDFLAGGKGVAFGKAATRTNAVDTIWDYYDKHGTQIRNGLALYESSGSTDCDTTVEEVFISATNTPDTGLWNVRQIFYNNKTSSSNRTQIAIPYAYGSAFTNSNKSNYRRHYVNGTGWSDWIEEPVIVKQGTSGIWTYVKWSSGLAECWGKYTVSSLDCTTALGSMYRTAVVKPDDFPFTLVNPYLFAEYETAGYGAFLWTTTETSSTTPSNYYLVRPVSGTVTGVIKLYVKGTWK